mmetsp:Transcript_1291/g.2730  ORF Transcript_1291/g.2730 Transcript_1291/m.2730 type:complete len:433 (+) Transcript_1291:114-1412(+)
MSEITLRNSSHSTLDVATPSFVFSSSRYTAVTECAAVLTPSLRQLLSWLVTVLSVRAWILVMAAKDISSSQGIFINDMTSLRHLPPIVHNASMVIQLGGEMGNQLSMISVGLALRQQARYLGIHARIVLRHQDHSKWMRAREATQTCFIKTKSMDFEAANTEEFSQISKAQTDWLGKNNTFLFIDNESTNEDMDHSLKYWKEVLDRQDRPSVVLKNASPVSVPHLFVNRYIKNEQLDLHFDDIRDFFRFDHERCCKLRASAEEIVLHMRLFLTEMPRRGRLLGFEELSPMKVANELFHNTNRGENITILSRFSDHNVKPYKDALDAVGFQTRVLSGQEGVEDFCYLMSATKEIVGTEQSSFFKFAAVLGNATKARLYFVESPDTKEKLLSRFRGSGFDYQWKHPLLKRKIVIEKYKSEVQDILDAIAINATV